MDSNTIKDALVERNHRILSHEAAKSRDIGSLQRWVSGNAYLASEESEYLMHAQDLMFLGTDYDSVVTRMESLVEDAFIRFSKRYRKVNIPFHRCFMNIY